MRQFTEPAALRFLIVRVCWLFCLSVEMTKYRSGGNPLHRSCLEHSNVGVTWSLAPESDKDLTDGQESNDCWSAGAKRDGD